MLSHTLIRGLASARAMLRRACPAIGATCLLLLWGACDPGPSVTGTTADVAFGKGKGGGGPSPDPVPLDAAFGDAPGDGMVSDGDGDYDAEFMENGNFRLDTTEGVPRTLCFNFPASSGLTPAEVGFPNEPDLTGLCDDAFISTGNPFLVDDVTPGVRLPDMGVGQVQRARLGGFYVREGFNWTFRWGRDCDLNDVEGDRATITRTSATQWTIAVSRLTGLCKKKVKGKPQTEVVAEDLSMPAVLTLTDASP